MERDLASKKKGICKKNVYYVFNKPTSFLVVFFSSLECHSKIVGDWNPNIFKTIWEMM